MKKVLLIIDPGHYSWTPGKRTPPFANGTVIREFEFNRPTASKLISMARASGFETVDTMPIDKEVRLSDRVKIANDAAKVFKALNPDGIVLFISIHYNAIANTWGGSTASGSEVFHHTGSIEGNKLATFVEKEMAKGTQQVRRGVKPANFYVLKYTSMPAILCEFGFMDEPKEAILMRNPEYQEECAREVLDGVKSYLGIEKEVGTPLMGPATATIGQAQTWARIKEAPQEFIDLAPLYWEIWSEIGLDPAIGYVQFAHETGFLYRDGKSMAGLDASYHNPCGLKTTIGGGDYVSSAHTRFPDWRTGITAHADHAALYAGAPGYPKANSPDPRHFKWINGVAKTLESLGARWAPNPNYGIGIRDKFLIPMQETVAEIVEDDWKTKIVKEAFDNGLIEDLELWLEGKDQPMPTWAVLAIANKNYKGGTNK